MFSASDAKKNAENNKVHISDVTRLLNHFEALIRKASNLGKNALDKQSFATADFAPAAVEEVVTKLKEHGYKVVLSKDNAYQKTIYEISW